MTKLHSYRVLVTAVVLTLIACTTAAFLIPQENGKTVTAYFSEAPGLYAGDPVRALGVDVGKIESITNERGGVKVVLRYGSDVQVPADANAAIVSPTLVSSRFVQLAPAYIDGPVLPDDATIPLSRTATPVEWDTTVKQMTDLANQLGPHQGDTTGALGRLLGTTQANLGGQGDQIHETIRNASGAMSTLAAGGEDLFGTVRNLQSVTTSLAQNDGAVQAFSQQLTQVSSVLADNRNQLATVVQTLDQVSTLVQNFLHDNRNELSTDLTGLTKISQELAGNRQALADFLQRVPLAASNLNNDYDPVGSDQDGAFALGNLSDPATFVCSLIFAAGGKNDNTNATCEAAIAPFVQVLKMNNIPLSFPLQTAPLPRGGGR